MMANPRVLGMMINHREVDHLLTSLSDTIRNTAYKVAGAQYPVGSPQRGEWFDEDGTLKGYDEDTNKSLLKDALDHYIEFCTSSGSVGSGDFNYYLGDSFKLIADYVNNDSQLMSYMSGLFARACGVLATNLAPVLEDITSTGHIVERIESYSIGSENSYYLVHGEDIDHAAGYDPKEDDLSSVMTNDSPEVLAKWESDCAKQLAVEKGINAFTDYTDKVNEVVADAIENGTYPRKRINMRQFMPKVEYTGLTDMTVIESSLANIANAIDPMAPKVETTMGDDPYTLNITITNPAQLGSF